jgi:hypothetical protein
LFLRQNAIHARHQQSIVFGMPMAEGRYDGGGERGRSSRGDEFNKG